jgi:hypothetical protein
VPNRIVVCRAGRVVVGHSAVSRFFWQHCRCPAAPIR